MNPAIYLHLPFCQSKCSYCSFNSYPAAGHDLQKYLTALLTAITLFGDHPWSKTQQFSSLFFGGGTPTLYTPDQLKLLIDSIRHSFVFQDSPEITLEANPNTLSEEVLTGLQKNGINRLSIGVQSFSDHRLQAIGRTHSADQAENSVRLARQAGFTNINLDLIYGFPGQTGDEWRQTLHKAMDLAPQHLAIYELTIEKNSLLARQLASGELRPLTEDDLAHMEDQILALLPQNGYKRYEISNYCRGDEFRCRHNLNYWHNGSYLGLGAGAVSCLDGLRLQNIFSPPHYADQILQGAYGFEHAEALPVEGRFRETVIMGLRLIEGISLKNLQSVFGIDARVYYGAILTRLIDLDLIEITNGNLKLTGKGLPIADRVLAELV